MTTIAKRLKKSLELADKYFGGIVAVFFETVCVWNLST